jgi:hypothetical protein
MFIEGSLVSWDSTGLALQLSSAEQPDTFMPWPDITRLELYAGRRSNMATGALVGGLAGLAIGSVIMIASCPCEASTGEVIAVVGLVFVAPGALLGGLIGAASPSDRWTEVPPEPGTLGKAPADEPARLDEEPQAEARSEEGAVEWQLGADFLYLSGMGSGPGVEASLTVTGRSGMRFGLGGELFFGGTTEDWDAQVDWSATGVFAEFGYRFSSTGWMPYAGVRPELLWAHSERKYEWEGEQIVETGTESDLALGFLAGIEKRFSSSFGASFTGIAVISMDEEDKNRYGIRVGGRYLF